MSSSDVRPASDRLNVHPLERLLSVGIGACLFQSGWRDTGVGGCLKMILGASLTVRGLRGHCPLYEAFDIDTRAWPEGAAQVQGWQEAHCSLVIARPPSELYKRWRNLSSLPDILSHVEKVDLLDDRRSRWTVSGPGGARLEFESRIEQDEPDRRITWRSSEEADVQNEGSVEFQPEGTGATRVVVRLRYLPPGGTLGRLAARLFGRNADRRLADDLYRFKQRMEAEAGARSTGGTTATPSQGSSATSKKSGGPSTSGPSTSGPSGSS